MTVFRDVSAQRGGGCAPEATPMISGTAWNFRACDSSLESSQQMENDGVLRISVSYIVPGLLAYICSCCDIMPLYGKYALERV